MGRNSLVHLLLLAADASTRGAVAFAPAPPPGGIIDVSGRHGASGDRGAMAAMSPTTSRASSTSRPPRRAGAGATALSFLPSAHGGRDRGDGGGRRRRVGRFVGGSNGSRRPDVSNCNCNSGHGDGSTRLRQSSSYDYDTSYASSRRESVVFQLQTLLRVLLPATVSGLIAFASMPRICFHIARYVTAVTTSQAKIGMLSDAVGSFISLVGLLYSILVGQVFGFLYSQQEALYLSLFDEVTEAKSLLEQVALVSQGRTMYSTCLSSIARYVKEDLLGGTLSAIPLSGNNSGGDGLRRKTKSSTVTPSLILSARPADDPLEAILYLTSVGIPGQVYDTVRSLRQARARRLGALQRKVPAIHLVMLWILGLIMLGSFPFLVVVGSAAGTGAGLSAQTFPHTWSKVGTLQGGLFGVATFAVVMTKMVLGELWRTKGGAYNVDGVLGVMVRGLQKELEERTAEAKKIMKRSNKKAD